MVLPDSVSTWRVTPVVSCGMPICVAGLLGATAGAWIATSEIGWPADAWIATSEIGWPADAGDAAKPTAATVSAAASDVVAQRCLR